MGFSNVGNTQAIRSWEQADAYFKSRPAHTRCKGWQSDERCLKERPSGNRHYRLEQHNDGEFYDVCLYQTVMARFYKPTEDGLRRALYAGHGSTTSKNFQYQVLGLWNGQSYLTTDNRNVIVPLYQHNTILDKNDWFTADITTTAEHYVVVDKSQHTPHYILKSNADDRAMRKRVKEKFANYIMLAQLRMPEFAANCDPTNEMGRPFGGSSVTYNERMSVESIWEMEADDLVRENHWVDHFFDMCQNTYDMLVSKRGYEQSNFRMRNRWNSTIVSSTPEDLEKPITEKDLETAILSRVYKLVGANTKSERVDQPQFMDADKYPRSTIRYD